MSFDNIPRIVRAYCGIVNMQRYIGEVGLIAVDDFPQPATLDDLLVDVLDCLGTRMTRPEKELANKLAAEDMAQVRIWHKSIGEPWL